MKSLIDDLYVELGERARRIVEPEKESERPMTGGVDRVFAFGKEMDIRELFDELLKANKRISALKSELAKKETLLKIREDWCKECKEKSVIEKLKETPIIEEPLPFSCHECEEDRIGELEKRIVVLEDHFAQMVERSRARDSVENFVYDR